MTKTAAPRGANSKRSRKRAASPPAGSSPAVAAPEKPGDPEPPLPPITAATVLNELARIAFGATRNPGPPRKEDAGRRFVTHREKKSALIYLGRHLGLFSGRRSTKRPFAELSDAELKARSEDVVRALAGMGVEVRIADREADAEGGAPRPD